MLHTEKRLKSMFLKGARDQGQVESLTCTQAQMFAAVGELSAAGWCVTCVCVCVSSGRWARRQTAGWTSSWRIRGNDDSGVGASSPSVRHVDGLGFLQNLLLLPRTRGRSGCGLTEHLGRRTDCRQFPLFCHLWRCFLKRGWKAFTEW